MRAAHATPARARTTGSAAHSLPWMQPTTSTSGALPPTCTASIRRPSTESPMTKAAGRVRKVAVIEVIGLRRTYRTTTGIVRRSPLDVEAVRGISFEVGHGVVREAREVRKRIGYVLGGERGLYERLVGLENLRYFAELYGLSGKRQRARVDEVLELVGLHGRERER